MKNKTALTLIELLLAMLMVGLLVLTFVSIQRFSLHHVLASHRRSVLQNEGYVVLEHMAKNFRKVQRTGPDSGWQILDSGAKLRLNVPEQIDYLVIPPNIQFINSSTIENLTKYAAYCPVGLNFTQLDNATVGVYLRLQWKPASGVCEGSEDNPVVEFNTTLHTGQASINW